jgi:hypothetical protein
MAQYLKHLDFVEFELEADKVMTSSYLPIVEVVEMIDTDGNPFPVTEYD